MDILEKATKDLEASIKLDASGSTTAAPATDAGATGKPLTQDDVRKAISDGIKGALGLLGKAVKPGVPRTDNTADEAPKDDDVIETESDPAVTPVKSGKGYKDTRPYKKGDEEHDDDEDGDDDGDDEAPAFFKKKGKGKKKMKKAKADGYEAAEGEGAEGELDVSEYLDNMGEAVDYIGKSVMKLSKTLRTHEDGLATFGELLAELGDGRRDRLMVAMQKGLTACLTEIRDLKKSLGDQATMMKAISQMPGAPRAAAMHIVKAEASAAPAPTPGVPTDNLQPGEWVPPGKTLNKAQRTELFKAVSAKTITIEEFKAAQRTGDLSCLAK